MGLEHSIKHKLALGVGNMEAMMNCFLYLNENKEINEIIFIGSAGTYDTKLCPLFSIVKGKDYYYRELAAWKLEANSPKLLEVFIPQTEVSKNKSIFSRWNLDTFSVNCPHSISLIPISDLPVWEHGPILENMEAFGLAKLASKLGFNFTSVFGITNEVGRNGSNDWLKNYKLVSKNLIQEINIFLQS
ncbi:MAG: hypothetical protein MH321_09455 [Leptospiraceae bacterium]|nr:hypothetical protein [Leptospiraceae bacterium]